QSLEIQATPRSCASISRATIKEFRTNYLIAGLIIAGLIEGDCIGDHHALSVANTVASHTTPTFVSCFSLLRPTSDLWRPPQKHLLSGGQHLARGHSALPIPAQQ